MFTASQGSNWINWPRYEHLFLLASNPGLELKERFQLRSNQLRKQLLYVFRRRVAVASFTLATIALKLRSDQPVQPVKLVEPVPPVQPVQPALTRCNPLLRRHNHKCTDSCWLKKINNKSCLIFSNY